ncbi:MAG: hypothetical protein MZV64_70895 [Ignavibacteriales bacterium]|nr:hypothetical protein [Ignavibacteriales bacterium]
MLIAGCEPLTARGTQLWSNDSHARRADHDTPRVDGDGSQRGILASRSCCGVRAWRRRARS